MYRSDDAGATWRKVNNANPRPMYFSQVRIDPNDPEVVYLGGVDLHQTLDGGKTINTAAASRTHSDHHAIWINPSNSNHVLIGNDGGLAVSYDMSKTWIFLPNLPVGLFYHVSYDMATPYNVCGGMQDNYSWCGPSQVRGTAGIGNHHWATIQGGDGFVVLQDPTDSRIVYSESQDGNMVRLDRVTFESMSIRPVPGPGEPALRWHWDTPLVHSPHDAKVLYAAANKVFRSPDKGLSWVAVSQDLTSNQDRDEVVTMGVKGSDVNISKNDGIAAWPAIVAFAESPKRAGVLYAGTDDGNLAVTRDAGKTWTQVIEKVAGVPKGVYVSEVVPSRFDEGTVYATFDAHRQNDFETHIYASNDFGQTWRSIAANLKGEIARTLTEDLKNPDVLYLGTETGTLRVARSGQGLAAAEGQPADGEDRRDHAAPSRQRDDPGHARTHDLDPRQSVAHPGILGGADGCGGREAVCAVADRDVPASGERSQLSVLGRSDVLRREPAAGGGHLVVPQEPGRERPVEDCRRRRQGSARDLGNGAREQQSRRASSRRAGICACSRHQRRRLAEQRDEGRVAAQAGRRRTRRCAGSESVRSGLRRRRWRRPRRVWRRRRREPRTLRAAGAPIPFRSSSTARPSTANRCASHADPEVLLTEAERKKMFDMAMEMHELQRRGTDVGTGMGTLNSRLGELAKETESKTDVPADLKASLETLQKDVAALAPKLTVPAFGGRGFGGGGGGAGAARETASSRA